MTLLLIDSEARALTAPYHGLWGSAFRAAEKWYWEDFRTWDPQAFIDMDAGARATILNRRITGNVSRGDGIKMSEALGFPVQVVSADGLYAIVRFKMLDPGLKPSNHPSDQQDGLQNHEFPEDAVRQLELDGGQPKAPTILTVGYQLTQLQTAFSQLAVVCWHGGSIRFWYDPESEDESSGGTILRLPIGDAPDEARVISKRRDKEAESSSDTDPGPGKE